MTCEMWANAGLVRHKGGPLLGFAKVRQSSQVGLRRLLMAPPSAQGIMGVMLLSMGGLVALAIGSEASRTTTYPGLDKLLVAAVFPIGLIMIVLSGVDLVTSNMAICEFPFRRAREEGIADGERAVCMSTIKRKTPWWSGPANVGVVLMGNLMGSLIVAGLFGKASGVFGSEAYTACASFSSCLLSLPDANFSQM